MSTFTGSDDCFIPLEKAKQLLSDQIEGTCDLFDSRLYLCVRKQETDYILKDDLPFYLRLSKMNYNITETDHQRFGGGGSLFSQFLKISDYTAVYLPDRTVKKPFPAFVRNLFYYSEFMKDAALEEKPSHFEVMGITVVTYEIPIKHYMEQVISRKQELDRIRHTNFVNSASYMGNKKKIAGFIIEAIFPYISTNSVFLDIMCGSGAMSQAFAQIGPTYASDAQEFCQLLAKVQGRGFSKKRAAVLLERIIAHYDKHLLDLTACYQEQLEEEAALYLQDWSDKDRVFARYTAFSSKFELYSSTDMISEQLESLMTEYKVNHRKYPYCLFTLYFSNVFFGLMQCIQLDSLRYAIDQLSGEDRSWALGVLIVTAYHISSGHAGHFAQPKRLTKENILTILSSRQKSAYHEFSKRFLCLAEESSRCPNEIKTISGPWQNALKFVENHISEQMVVYLDAPYKRDEYSRYYHVLETLVQYDYPSSELKGRLRSKKLGERFSTEFFTKTASKIEDVFIRIISEVLSSGKVCVWSYSDNGAASIIDIIASVKKQTSCRVHLYGIPYQHQSQRGADKKRSVIEYCIIFSPAK